MKLDRQFIAASNENNNLKTKLVSQDNRERELQDVKYRFQMMENDFFELQKENHSLKNQLHSLQERAGQTSSFHNSSSHSHHHNPPPSSALATSTSYRDYSSRPPVSSSSSSSVSQYPSYYEPPQQQQSSFPSSSSSQYKQNNSRAEYYPPLAVSQAPPHRPKSLSSTLADTTPDNRKFHSPEILSNGGNRSNESSSLLNLLQGRNADRNSSHSAAYESPPSQMAINRRNNSSMGLTPFATDITNVAMVQGWEQLEKDLTQLMTEKNSLRDEGEK
jgi:hypothetical protein